MAPVHELSLVGLGFCAVGSGWAVLTIQSALPAVSALLLSNRTRCGVAACAGGATAVSAAATVMADRATSVRARAMHASLSVSDRHKRKHQANAYRPARTGFCRALQAAVEPAGGATRVRGVRRRTGGGDAVGRVCEAGPAPVRRHPPEEKEAMMSATAMAIRLPVRPSALVCSTPGPASRSRRDFVSIADRFTRRASEPSDEALVRTLYQEHGRSLLAYATRLTGDRAAAEDVVQETLIRAWKHSAAMVNEKGSVRGWLLTVARNIITDRVRAKAARPTEVAESPTTPPIEHDHAEGVVNTMTVLSALDRVSPEHKEILVELYYRGR